MDGMDKAAGIGGGDRERRGGGSGMIRDLLQVSRYLDAHSPSELFNR